MAIGDVQVTFVGNLTADPELRFTSSAVPVASFTVICSKNIFDKETKEWKEGEKTYLRCSVWREYAENVVESLRTGSRVMVMGKLSTHSWETKEGEKRFSLDVQVEEMCVSLRYAHTEVFSTTTILMPQSEQYNDFGTNSRDNSAVRVVGTVSSLPNLTYTPSGVAVANFTVECQPKYLDKTSGEWRDGEQTTYRCTVWRNYAENVAASLKVGTRVMLSGQLKPTSALATENGKSSVFDVEVEEVGPVLRSAKIKITRNSSGQPARSSEDSDTSWETGTNAWGSAPTSDEPPF